MTAREWKPGDVALVSYAVSDQPSIKYHGQSAIRWRYGWIAVGVNGDYEMVHDPYVTKIRPLVVIDPEDREQVERLVDEFRSLSGWASSVKRESANALQAALREFANPTPPKPDEPTGLGAVVEDDKGARWVQFSSNSGNWWRNHIGRNARWSDIAAVKVLSEGVTP